MACYKVNKLQQIPEKKLQKLQLENWKILKKIL